MTLETLITFLTIENNTMNNCIVTFEYRVMVTAFAILAMFISNAAHRKDAFPVKFWATNRSFIKILTNYLLLTSPKSSLIASYFRSKVPYIILMDSFGPPSTFKIS